MRGAYGKPVELDLGHYIQTEPKLGDLSFSCRRALVLIAEAKSYPPQGARPRSPRQPVDEGVPGIFITLFVKAYGYYLVDAEFAPDYVRPASGELIRARARP
jgi:hypothetical protein